MTRGLSLLRSYLGDPSPAAANALIEHLLPVISRWLFRTYRSDDRLPADESLQYATLGMIDGVKRFEAAGIRDVDTMQRFVVGCARKGIIQGYRTLVWGGEASPKKLMLKRLRRRFILDHGRLPTARETESILAPLVKPK